MTISYAEYLKTTGADDETIKTLDHPAARKAFDKIQSDLAEQERLRTIAQTDFQNIRDWYDTKALPSYEKMQRETVEARGERAKALELLKAAQDAGLAELADKMDDKKNAPPNPAHPDFDPNKYMAKDEFTGLADKVGGNLAKMQDAVLEHMQLFPNQRLNVSALRDEAAKAGKDFYTMWEQKYNVPAARQAADDAAKAAEIAKWKAEGAKEKETEIVSRMGNPDTRPLSPSTSPFAMRPATGRDKQPWEKGDMSGERVERATRKVLADVVH